jgi:DNA-binding response OmpR family regulator
MSRPLLLVEDDTAIGRMLERGLAAEGFAVTWRRDLRGGVAAVREETPALVVLDRNLPDGDGAELCRALRAGGVAAPILMLTARDALEDKLGGFEAGADDYLTKPFDFEELLARLAALSRRADPGAGGLTLRPAERAALWGGRRATFTATEWPILEALSARAGETVSRAELIALVWGEAEAVSGNSLDVYVGYVRRKLAALGAGPRIETMRGRGFRLTR